MSYTLEVQVHLMDIFVDITNRQLILGENTRQLEPKVSLLLQTLISVNGDVVSREQLIDQVWQGRVVGDGAINRTVSLLRQHLAALDSENNFVVTVPKAGYKLLHIKKSHLAPQIKLSPTDVKKLPLKFIFSFVSITLLAVLYYWLNPQSTQVSFNKHSRITAQFGAEYGLSVDNQANNILYQQFDNKTLSNQVYLVKKASNTQKLNIDHQIYNAAISPNGQLVAMSYKVDEQCYLGFYEFSTQSIHNIQKCASDSFSKFTWHWNSDTIYFRNRSDKTQAYIVNKYNIKTERKSLITLPPSHSNLKGDYLLDHHPNKNWLLIARYIDENNTQLLILDSFTNETKYSYKLAHHIDALAWLNKQFASFADNGAVYLINVLTGEVQLKFKNSHTINSMDSTVNQLFFSSFEHSSNIFKQNIATGTRVAINTDNVITQLPKIRNNGQLSYLSNKQSIFQWQISGDENISSLPINLPFKLGFDRYEWSHDGRYILLTKQGAIYQIDADNDEIQQLTQNEIGAFVVNYDPNGNIIYSSSRSGQWQLWLYKVKDKTHEQLTQFGGYSGRIKGNYLYFTKFNTNGLWQLDLLNGEEQLLIADVDIINWLNWQLINNNIYFYRPESGVWKYELDTEKQSLILSPEKRFLHQFSVAADEKTIYFVENQNIEGDIYKVPYVISN